MHERFTANTAFTSISATGISRQYVVLLYYLHTCLLKLRRDIIWYLDQFNNILIDA